MYMYMTDTFCSFTRNVIFKSFGSILKLILWNLCHCVDLYGTGGDTVARFNSDADRQMWEEEQKVGMEYWNSFLDFI